MSKFHVAQHVNQRHDVMAKVPKVAHYSGLIVHCRINASVHILNALCVFTSILISGMGNSATLTTINVIVNCDSHWSGMY